MSYSAELSNRQLAESAEWQLSDKPTDEEMDFIAQEARTWGKCRFVVKGQTYELTVEMLNGGTLQ